MTTVQRWGNSLAVRIPASLADQMRLEAGAPVEVTSRSGELVIRPIRTRSYRLKNLLKDCRPEQLHGELDLGADMGREIIP